MPQEETDRFELLCTNQVCDGDPEELFRVAGLPEPWTGYVGKWTNDRRWKFSVETPARRCNSWHGEFSSKEEAVKALIDHVRWKK